MTEAELKRIEDAFDATTSGRWEVCEETGVIINDEKRPGDPWYVTDAIEDVKSPGDGEANTLFIVMAHETIPQLLAEVRRLRSLCDRIVADRIQDSDVALEAVRREREAVAKVARSLVDELRRSSDSSFKPGILHGGDFFVAYSNAASMVERCFLADKP